MTLPDWDTLLQRVVIPQQRQRSERLAAASMVYGVVAEARVVPSPAAAVDVARAREEAVLLLLWMAGAALAERPRLLILPRDAALPVWRGLAPTRRDADGTFSQGRTVSDVGDALEADPGSVLVLVHAHVHRGLWLAALT